MPAQYLGTVPLGEEATSDAPLVSLRVETAGNASQRDARGIESVVPAAVEGDTAKHLAGGVATFEPLNISGAVGYYILRASAPGLLPVRSRIIQARA